MSTDPSEAGEAARAPSEREHGASNTLLSAALAGLLGIVAATACGSDGNGTIDSGNTGGRHHTGGHTGSGGSASGGSGGEEYNDVVSTDEMTFAEFDDLCAERGGLVTTHAHCAGSNICKGLSYADDGTTLTDHSCKGMNSCTGMSCVDLPEDSKLSGQEIYEAGPCAGCHNNASKGASTYVVFVPPGGDHAAALSSFEKSSNKRLAAIVALGTQGVYEDGTAFSNMPSYRDRYSLAEIERAVEYLRALEHPTVEYTVPSR